MLDSLHRLLAVFGVAVAVPYLNLSIRTAIRTRHDPNPLGASRIRPIHFDIAFAVLILVSGCYDLQDWIAWGCSSVVKGGTWVMIEVIAAVQSLFR